MRYVVSNWAAQQFGAGCPWGTMIINFTGSLLLAVFIAWLTTHTTVDPRVRLFIAVGFFGAYTTYSTFAVESITLLQTGNWIGALSNIVGTTGVCTLGALVGFALGSRL